MSEKKKTTVLISNEELLKRQLKQAHDLIDSRLRELAILKKEVEESNNQIVAKLVELGYKG